MIMQVTLNGLSYHRHSPPKAHDLSHLHWIIQAEDILKTHNKKQIESE
jgi:hypothetical protein